MVLLEKKFKISVIIPFYNAKIYLERCVRSLFTQTFSEMEFVFVDDCSLDGGADFILEILKEYPNRQGQVKIVPHAKRSGVAQARNTGLANANGDYIGWCDADDWVEKTMFSDLYTTLKQEQADLVWCNFYMDFPDRQILDLQEIEPDPKQFAKALIAGKMQGMLWNKLVRTRILKDNNIQFLAGCNMGEDRNFLFKILCQIQKIVHVPVGYYHYVQQNSNSLTQKFDSQLIYEEIENIWDIDFYSQRNSIGWIDREEMRKLKFRTKLNLLFTSSMADFKAWGRIFKDSNDLVYSYPMKMKHRALAVCALYRIWPLIKLWIYVKQKNK